MKANTTYLRRTLKEAVKFLGLTTTEDILDCTLKQSEGAFHRVKSANKTQLLSFPQDVADILQSYISITEWYLQKRCPEPPWCLERSRVDFTNAPYTLPPK